MSQKISNLTVLVGGTEWIVTGAYQFDINVRDNTVEAVLGNVYNILQTPLGSQVLLRAFGIDQRWIDQPGNIGQFQARTAALLAIGLWEPRAKVIACDFGLDTANVLAGNYTLYLELEIDLTRAVASALYSAPSAAPVWVLDAPFDPNGATVPTVQSEVLNIFTG
jgi:phage baseplate assembly protein W